MHNERTKGIAYSLAFHVLLLLVLIFGLPSLLKNEPPEEPTVITVEILPIKEKSNVLNSLANKSDQTIDKPAPTQQNPSPPVKTPEPTPPTPPEPTPAPVPPKPPVKQPDPVKTTPKPTPAPPPAPIPPKPQPPKKPIPKQDPLDAILKAVKQTAQNQAKDKPKEPVQQPTSPTPKAISKSPYDPSQIMSLSEKDAIMQQFIRCWSPPTGAKDAGDLIVIIHAQYNTDGSLIKAAISNETMSKSNSDSFYRAAAEAALRAVQQCTPLKNLSPDKYAAWGELDLYFNPKDMLQ